MAAPYTTQEMDGHTVWFNARGEQVAHYPDMLLHTVLRRTLEASEASGLLTAEQAALLETAMIDAWPMQADDSAEQFNARHRLVGLFRLAGLLA